MRIVAVELSKFVASIGNWPAYAWETARVKIVSHSQYSVFFWLCPLFALCICTGCADRRTVRSALAASSEALESHDPEDLFEVLDERARFALATIVKARRAARELIEKDYPTSAQASALAALGEAAQVSRGAELFARRCGPSCVASFAELVAPPASEVVVGDEVEVTTVRGRALRLHAGSDGRYGLVWNTRHLAEEVSQVSRELAVIRDNAAVYRKKSALAHGR